MSKNSWIIELERAYDEWAETSQHNYQRAKRYKAALEQIAKPRYGLQGIVEDYPDPDSIECLQATLDYYKRLVYLYQTIAREAE